MLLCLCGISSAEEKKPGLELACDQLTHQLCANEKCPLSTLTPKGVGGGGMGSKEAFSVGRGTGQLGWFQWTPRMGSIWGVLGGQSGWRKQMALRPPAISWSISREERKGRDERERESRREKNQLAQTQALVGLLWKRNLGEESSV